MGSYKGVGRKEEKNDLGSNSLFVSGRDSEDGAITVYSEYLPKCIYAVRQTQELPTQVFPHQLCYTKLPAVQTFEKTEGRR